MYFWSQNIESSQVGYSQMAQITQFIKYHCVPQFQSRSFEKPVTLWFGHFGSGRLQSLRWLDSEWLPSISRVFEIKKCFLDESLGISPEINDFSREEWKEKTKSFFDSIEEQCDSLFANMGPNGPNPFKTQDLYVFLCDEKNSVSTENHFSRKCWVFGMQGLIFGCSISIQSTLMQSTSETRAIQSNLNFFQHTILSKHLPVSTVYHQTHPSWRISCHITLGRTLQERNATNSKS